MKKLLKLTTYLLAPLLLGSTVGAIATKVFGIGPAIEIHDTKALTTEVHPGGTLKLLIDSQSTNSCSLTVRREFWRMVDVPGYGLIMESWYISNIQPLPGPTDSFRWHIVNIPVPQNIDSGSWNYRAYYQVGFDCSLLGVFTPRAKIVNNVQIKVIVK